ncbi:MAG: hypothetical protein GX348_10745 [Veillonellaceae bacterium]|jgi:hypothetical protein|nr:hypothetical protein [Veillonellaceae bacterium]
MIEKTILRELIQKYFSEGSDDQISMLVEALGKELDQVEAAADSSILIKSKNIH